MLNKIVEYTNLKITLKNNIEVSSLKLVTKCEVMGFIGKSYS